MFYDIVVKEEQESDEEQQQHEESRDDSAIMPDEETLPKEEPHLMGHQRATHILENQDLPDHQSEYEDSLHIEQPMPNATEQEWSCQGQLLYNADRPESERVVLNTFADDDQQASMSYASSNYEEVRYHQHPIYEYYEKVAATSGTCSTDSSIEFRCKCCGDTKKTIIKVKGSTTSNLLRHIERAHHSKYVIFQKAHKAYHAAKLKASLAQMGSQPKQKLMAVFVNKKKIKPKEKEELDDALALMIAQDLQPLSVVENEGFRSFVRKLNCNYDIPSRKSLTYSILPKMQRYVKREAFFELGKANQVALTFDLWTLPANDAYLALTAHVLQQPTCVRKQFCLGVRSLPEQHTSENLVEQISLILQEFSLPMEQISSITTDNGTVVVKAVNLLGLSEKHVRCMGHCFHLIVTESIKDVRCVDYIFDKCRSISKYFRNIPASSHLLKYMQTRNKLPETKLKVDVSTRWNSMYDMVKRVLEQEISVNDALEAAAQINESHSPNIPQAVTANEASILKGTLGILEPFLIATEKLSGQAYPTLSMVIPIITELQASLVALMEQHTLTESTEGEHNGEKGTQSQDGGTQATQETTQSNHNSMIRLLCQTVKELTHVRFKNIENHCILGKATILDPRFKTYGFQEQYAADKHVKQLDFELEQLSPKTSSTTDNSESGPPPPKRKPESEFWKVLSKRKAESEKAKKSTASELYVYLAEEIEDFSIDVFSWWGRNSLKFPLLSQLAFKYLCGTATSIPSGQLFTKTGDNVTSRRACLKPSHMEMLTMIKTSSGQCH